MDQAFICDCKAKVTSLNVDYRQSALAKAFKQNCLGRIRGANYLTLQQLSAPKFVNPYILELAVERDRESLNKVQNRL